MAEMNSNSMESLDEDASLSVGVDAVDFNDMDDEPILGLLSEEPEAWSSTIDKKMLKKMKDKDIKRQENIYEFIVTEKHHCLTLKIMHKIFAKGMQQEVQLSQEIVEKIFPQLEKLIELHLLFFRKLRERQQQSPVLEGIGDIILQQFQDKSGEQMKMVYGEFCSRHKDAVSLYKDVLKSDRKFQTFIKKVCSNPLCKTRGIPECILLVTQRISKYPLLIEALIKSLKDCNKVEHMNLMEAKSLVRGILTSVNGKVAEKEREQRLLEMYNKIDAKSATVYRGKKFKKSDLLSNNRKLLFEGPVKLNQARGKVLDATAVVLSDVIFFLQDNNQKYSFVTQDNKAGVISLQKLLVREKAGLDSTGIYLISSNPSEPEMYELICPSRKDKKAWIEVIHSATVNCPEEDEGIPSEEEEERKMFEARNSRVRQLEISLHERDHRLASICEEKMKIFVEMMNIACKEESTETFKYVHLIDEMQEGPETRELLLSALQEATRLASSLYSEGTNLSRSVSSVGEHQSETYVSPILPKRAETFGGFDNPNKDSTIAIPKANGLKKKFHLLKDSDGRAASLLNLASRTEKDSSSSADSTDPFLQVKVKEVRRASGPLPSIETSSGPESPDQSLSSSRRSTLSSTQLSTAKCQQDRNFLTVESASLSDRDTIGELVNFSSTPPLVTLGKEKWVAAVQLSHYLNTLLCLFSQHFTNVESLRAQLAVANEHIAKLDRDSGRDRNKRNLYRHNPQLEELRNLQEQLTEERASWQRDLENQKEMLEKERQEICRQQEQMKEDQADITNQRDQLYRYLEVLQRHGITLSPNMAIVGSFNEEQNEASPIAHRRNSSTDIPNKDGANRAPLLQPCDTKKPNKLDNGTKGRTNSTASIGIVKRDSFPLNLCSATNQQKAAVAQPVRQQLPLKLASKESAKNAEFPAGTSLKSFSSVSQAPQAHGTTAAPLAQAVNLTFLSRSSEKRGGSNEAKSTKVKDHESNQEIFFF